MMQPWISINAFSRIVLTCLIGVSLPTLAYCGFQEAIPESVAESQVPAAVTPPEVSHSEGEKAELLEDKNGSEQPLAITTVGLAKKVEQLVLPGGKRKVKTISDRHDPFVLRILATYPHGTDTRYDFEFYGLEPGDYDLVQYLEKDSTTEAEGATVTETDLTPAIVRVVATLPAGQFTPAPIPDTPLPWLGGYRWWWTVGGVLWILGLYALLFAGRKQQTLSTPVATPKLSLADQLRPLVQAARDGTLGTEQRATLERTLIAFWCKRLQIGTLPPGQVMAKLREHAEAGPLVQSLEEWLHCPDPQAVDIDALLRPYANVTDVELESALPDVRRSLEQGASVV